MSLTAFALVLCFCSAAATATEVTSPPPSAPILSAYDILQSFNFPIGLLPKGSTGYEFDPATGKFAVYFDGECGFTLQGTYQIRYQPTITGRLLRNKLKDLRGISVKFLLFWINIVEVDRVGENLEFSIGIASADFGIENFIVCPQCGCGMDCGGDEEEAETAIELRGSF